MATSTPAAARARRVLRKSITFAAGAGTGDVGTVAALTVTGTVWVECLNIHCTTTLVGSTATISLGIAGDTACIIPVTLASTVTTGLQWTDTPPDKVVTPINNIVLSNNALFTIAVAGLTAGAVEIEIVFDSLSGDGFIS